MHTSKVRFVRAGLSDLDTVTDMQLEVLDVFQGLHTAEQAAALRPNLRSGIAHALEGGNYVCWLAFAGNVVAGFGGMSVCWRPGNYNNPGGLTGYIIGMYTRAEYRGLGICSALVQHLIGSGHELGITHFELHATKDGEPVYQKLGFKLYQEPTYRKYEAAPGVMQADKRSL